jgi:hypothetical protein
MVLSLASTLCWFALFTSYSLSYHLCEILALVLVPTLLLLIILHNITPASLTQELQYSYFLSRSKISEAS